MPASTIVCKAFSSYNILAGFRKCTTIVDEPEEDAMATTVMSTLLAGFALALTFFLFCMGPSK